MPRSHSASPKATTAALGFEAKLWLAADKLRNNMDAAEYKGAGPEGLVLGLIFLKYISATFEEHRAKLVLGSAGVPPAGSSALAASSVDHPYAGANPEDPDEYRAENVFWVPADARWSHLQANAKQPTIGKIVDDAMVAIERDNPRLKGVLPKDYACPTLDKHRLGELIDFIGAISLIAPPSPPTGERADVRGQSRRSIDIFGRVYEYFLTQFANLRDPLLPKLQSGESSVAGLESKLEAGS